MPCGHLPKGENLGMLNNLGETPFSPLGGDAEGRGGKNMNDNG